MLFIDEFGHVDAEKIKVKIYPLIEMRDLKRVNGIVVHQTGGSSAASALGSYGKLQPNGDKPNGAHFLIDKDGSILQTASLRKTTKHVGDLQSRCVLRKTCSDAQLNASLQIETIKGNRARADAVNRAEMPKKFPDRFPNNSDAIGIEIVGATLPEDGTKYEPVNAAQNSSLKWLVQELAETLGVSMQEVYRHPEIGRKTESEASTARW